MKKFTLKNPISFFGSLMAFAFILLACSNSVDSDPDAQIPKITAISTDITTVLNVPETLSVGVEISDKGTLSYQWYVADSKLSDGEMIESASEAEFSPATDETGIFYYYCVITNRLGKSTRSVTSPRITYAVSESVDAKVPVIARQPENVTADFGENFTLSVTAYSADGGEISYQWYFSAKEDDDANEATAIDEATEANYSSTISADSLGSYYCVITNRILDNGDGGEKSTLAQTHSVIVSNDVVNVNTPTITVQPSDVSAIIPAVHVFYVGAYVADGGILSYQWYLINEGETNGMAIDGANEATYKAIAETMGKTGFYCVITSEIADNGDGGNKTASIVSKTAWFDAVYLKDVVPAPEFTTQPNTANVAPYNQTVTLSCEAEAVGYSVSYRWYKSDDGTTATGTAVTGANSKSLTTQKFTEKGTSYYYCVATVVLSAEGSDDVKSAAAISNIATVTCTGLPVIQIETVDGEEPTCDYVNHPVGENGAGITNATKVPSRMKIFKFGENSAIYDSGEYVKKESGLTIKIRGNTSAYAAKKPYKLKLQKKADLLANLLGRTGKKYKDKEWLLLKDGTSLNTFVGMTVADIAGTPWTPEFAYVNVVINGDYRGVYMLIEAISQSEGRVDVADDGYIIERDAYWWNEDVYFATGLNQKYTFKYPDDDDITQEQIDFIQDYMNTVESHVKDGTYEGYIDTESFARWQLIHDILGTWDSEGSNIYMSKYDSTTEENPYEDGTWSKIKMSTPWDFDSNYRMVDKWANVHNGAQIYAKRLFASENTAFLDSYKAQWASLSTSLASAVSVKLAELKSELGEDINLSRQMDAAKWGTSYSTVEANIATAENWFASRTTWLDNAIGGL